MRAEWSGTFAKDFSRRLAIKYTVWLLSVMLTSASSGCGDARLRPFEAHVSEYLSQPTEDRTLSHGAYVRGKVLFVDRDGATIDSINLRCPEKIAASTPEEVGTVVWLERSRHGGKYTDGSSGTAVDYHVTIIDFIRHAIVGRTFLHEALPGTKLAGGDQTWEPVQEAMDYLVSLPHVQSGGEAPRPHIRTFYESADQPISGLAAVSKDFSIAVLRLQSSNVSNELAICDAHSINSFARLKRLARGQVLSAALSSDARTLGCLVEHRADEYSMQIHDTETGALRHDFDLVWNPRPENVCFAPDGRTIAIGMLDGSIRLLDVVSGRTVKDFPGQGSAIVGIAFSPDGRLIAGVTSGNHKEDMLAIWDVKTGAMVSSTSLSTSWNGHDVVLDHVMFSSDGKRVVSTSSDPNAIHIVDLSGRKSTPPKLIHDRGSIAGLSFAEDGEKLAVAQTISPGSGADSIQSRNERHGEMTIWDTRTGKLKRRLACAGSIACVAFSPKKSVIALNVDLSGTSAKLIEWKASEFDFE